MFPNGSPTASALSTALFRAKNGGKFARILRFDSASFNQFGFQCFSIESGIPIGKQSVTAALTGLRKGEIRGLRWADFDGKELFVRRSFWNKVESEPKTRKSRAPVPVVKQLADALEVHRLRSGILAQPDLPIFQAGNGSPLNLTNLARRVIAPFCPKWHGWHAFRRGLATNLHALGIPDKEIQAILRHSNVGLTMNIYVKSVSESQVSAMDAFSEKLESCNVLATSERKVVN